jgi:DNA-binding response OmpR family regulator
LLQQAAEVAPVQLPSTTPETAERRILVAEDEGLLRNTLAAFLEGRGMRVERAASLAESQACLARAPVDLAILDVGLPDGDGLGLLGRLSPERVIVISARPEPARFERLGVRRHFAKPLDLVDLGRAVDDLLC